MCPFLVLILHGIVSVVVAAKSDAVLLTDVKVLTLHHGQMTNARRSSPIPQLKCVGGTAGCASFHPQTVQCINRGTDGYDVQWECKTDMDNSYRFGKIQVSCEGYAYPDDPYILRGSCGLEYTLDLSEEGHQRKNSGGGFGNQYNQYDKNYHDRSNYSYTQKTSNVITDLFYLCCVAGVVYLIYKTCIATPTPYAPPAPSAPPPSYDETFRNRQTPPPYGFRQDYMPNTDGASFSSGGCGGSTYTSPNPGAATGGGFWSGAFTGGLLGYLFGSSRTNTHYNQPRPRSFWGNGWGTGWGNSWGTGWRNNWGSGLGNQSAGSWGSGSSSHRSSNPTPSFSSGTRTASGFGGTSRR